MALVRQFYSEKDREGLGDSYSLARDVTTDRVFVLHCQTQRLNGNLFDIETKLSLGVFLSATGPAQRELLELIGSLVVESWSTVFTTALWRPVLRR